MATIEIPDELYRRLMESAAADYRDPLMQLAYLVDRREARRAATYPSDSPGARAKRKQEQRARDKAAASVTSRDIRDENPADPVTSRDVRDIPAPSSLDGSASVFPNPSNSTSLNPPSGESSSAGAPAHEGEPPAPRQRQPFPKPHPRLYRFEDFWAVYPRKVGKDKAQEAWDKLARSPKIDFGDALVDRIVAAVIDQATWPEWNRGREYIPHPTTWLNQGRWTDEPPPPDPPRRPGPPSGSRGSPPRNVSDDAIHEFLARTGGAAE